MNQPNGNENSTSRFIYGLILPIAGVLILWTLLRIADLSDSFAYETEFKDRPVVPMFKEFIFASAVWIAASAWVFFRRKALSTLDLWVVFLFAVVFRVTLIPTNPILEIDLYRYIWDGKATIATGNPYEIAPREFVQWRYAPEHQMNFGRTEQQLQDIKTFYELQGEGTRLIVERVHYGHFTSPYPPVSQAVFAATELFTPHDASLQRQVQIMKVVLVLFDLGVGLGLMLLLGQLKLPRHLAIGWLWCPLVLKEFANGGHLDSIAIFFCVLGLYFAVRYWQRSDSIRDGLLSAVWLGCGIGAKIFPLFIVPLWALLVLRKNLGQGIACIVALIVTSAALLYPMISQVQVWKDAGKVNAKPGILAFAEGWEMNDMLFMTVVENLKPYKEGDKPDIWFSVLDLDRRNQIVDWFMKISPDPDRDRLDIMEQKRRAAFKLTRMLGLGIFALILIVYGIELLRSATESVPMVFLNACCVSLAWFWFLSPTQNPWYWCWALPLIIFARSKTWFLVCVLALVYYLRFQYDYDGKVAEFDFYVPFWEFGPVLWLLVIESGFRFLNSRIRPDAPENA